MHRTTTSFRIPFILLLCTVTGWAAAPGAECERKIEIVKNTQASRQWFDDSSTCYVSISSSLVSDLSYRSYLFDNHGLFMVFNSYGEGPSSKFTGAREFYLFPRTGMSTYYVPDTGVVQVKTSSGALVEFDSSNSSPRSITDGVITEDPVLSRDNAGGVELTVHEGILLDLGFKLGESPASEPLRKVEFRDGRGKRCEVLNEEIFVYPDDPEAEIEFRHPTDAELFAFLARRCGF